MKQWINLTKLNLTPQSYALLKTQDFRNPAV